MTREEAREELKQDYILLPIRVTFTGLDVLWLGALITERLARREAEEKVTFLDAAVDEALKDRDYYHKKLEQAEAQVKELEEVRDSMMQMVAEDGRFHKQEVAQLEARVKELEEEIKDLVTGLNHQLDETNVLRARVKELEAELRKPTPTLGTTG